MKEKYIDIIFPFWMEFGVSPDGKCIDIAAGASGVDVATHVPIEQANKIMAAHNAFRYEYIDLLNILEKESPKAFSEYWNMINKKYSGNING